MRYGIDTIYDSCISVVVAQRHACSDFSKHFVIYRYDLSMSIHTEHNFDIDLKQKKEATPKLASTEILNKNTDVPQVNHSAVP